MPILTIAGYKFITLNELASLRVELLTLCERLDLRGTILLSVEGINISLAGKQEQVETFKVTLEQDPRFADMTYHHSGASAQPFQRLKIKLKKEIITMKQPDANPLATRAPAIAPAQLKQWLDEHRDITLLDTRNDYEVELGTFEGATNLHLAHFTELPGAVQALDKKKPVVMFCTGGIRCEKAALYMMNQGFDEVYQLDGGILGYFAKVGGAHYDGGCFVFDERVSIGPDMINS
jgi:UPF0176 protein